MKTTRHYGLRLWEMPDGLGREDLNGNFEKLDMIPEVVAGCYTGDETLSREILLGFRPLSVLIMDESGTTHSGQSSNGGFAVDGFPCVFASTTMVEVTDNGFRVGRGYPMNGGYWADSNGKKNYYYLAVKR